jgi:hypothetical protein
MADLVSKILWLNPDWEKNAGITFASMVQNDIVYKSINKILNLQRIFFCKYTNCSVVN